MSGPEKGTSILRKFDASGYQPGLKHFPDAPRAIPGIVDPAANDAMDLNAEGGDLYDLQLDIDQRAAEERQEMRDLIGKAEGGVLHNNKVGLKETDRDHHLQQAANNFVDNMLMGEAYQQAYNNEVSFKVNGRDFDMAQGEIFDFAKESADAKAQWLAQNGDRLSAEERQRAEEYIRHMRRIAELTDPNHGKMTDEERREFQSILDSDEEIAKQFEARAEAGMAVDRTMETLDYYKQQLNDGTITADEYANVRQEALSGMSEAEQHVLQQREDRLAQDGGSIGEASVRRDTAKEVDWDEELSGGPTLENDLGVKDIAAVGMSGTKASFGPI